MCTVEYRAALYASAVVHVVRKERVGQMNDFKKWGGHNLPAIMALAPLLKGHIKKRKNAVHIACKSIQHAIFVNNGESSICQKNRPPHPPLGLQAVLALHHL